MPRWSAAQMLSRIAPLGKPLKLEEWRSDMDGKILPAQLKLHEAIVQRRITDVRGRLGPPGSKQRIPDDLLSDPEFTLLVTLHGALTVHPPHKRHKFEEKYGIDLDNWWREIDFDQDEGEQVFYRPHLRLVLGGLKSEWDPRTEWSVETVFRELGIKGIARKQKVIVEALPKIYGDDIAGALDRLVAKTPWSTADLRNAIWKLLEQEAGKQLRDGEIPSWDACKDFLTAWHKRRTCRS